MKFESFRPKSEDELKAQAHTVEEVLGPNMYPPDTAFEDNLDISNIKEQYKTRYEAYVSSLRAIKKGDLNTNEIRHAKEWIKGLNNLDSYIKEHESKDNPLLREKQYVVYKKIRDFLEQGKKSGYVKLPTGTGKTILFLKIAEALNMKTLVVSPSKVILVQNAEETEEFTESEFGKYYGQEKDLSKKVTHITYHSLVKAVREGVINPEDYPIEIFDEAHRSLGHERTQTIDKFNNNIKLYFTATPDFSDDKKLSNNIEEIFRMDVADGIREGLICQTQTIHAYTDIDISNVNINTHGQYDQSQLEKAINIKGRNLSAIELYKQKFSHLKVFCNCAGIKHAEDVARLFNEEGIRAACITGGTPKEERERILREYKEGIIRVLTNARVLLEGFNDPSCSVTFNLHPTLSLVDAEQRARSSRLDKNSPDKWSYVVDFIDQNSQKPQVLYSNILDSDRVWSISPSNVENNDTQINISKQRQISEPRPPINLDNISVDGLRVVVDTQMIMEITNSKLKENVVHGWKTANSLKGEFSLHPHTIKKFAEQYRLPHPEWFNEFKTPKGIKVEHYSPELIEILKSNLLKESLIEGWLAIDSLKIELKSHRNTIKKFAEQYRLSHPEWFKEFKTGYNVTGHYSPELVEIIRKNFKRDLEIEKSPAGWRTASSLDREIMSDRNTIKKFVEQYKQSHKDWFKVYKTPSNQTLEHYSPELIELIIKELQKKKAPEGWNTPNNLSIKINRDSYTIKKFAEQYRLSHPEWFDKFMAGPIASEYYSPELIKIIGNEFIVKIPEGWRSLTSLNSEIKSSIPTIKKFAEKYRLSHPEWFKKLRPPFSGPVTEYYSPELIEQIKNDLE